MREEEPDHGADEVVTEGTEAGGEELVELILSEHSARAEARPARIDGVVIGRIAAFGPGGEALVDFPGRPGPSPLPARSAARLGPDARGRDAALMFEGGDPERPFVVGLIEQPVPVPEPAPAPDPLEVESDGERVVLSAEKEIVLRCGKASITLTRAGKILIRGEYVLTRASGVHRIQGGSVQIN